MTVYPHTNATVTFCRVIFLIWNTILLRDMNPICVHFNIQLKQSSYRYSSSRQKIITIIKRHILAMVYEHSVVQSAKFYVHYSSHKYHFHA
jgi:hypothetical protein